MPNSILDNLAEIKKLDSQNMLGSLQLLGKQIEQILKQAVKVKIPAAYKKAQNIVVLGMGGSAIGAHVIKSLFAGELKVPLEIVNGYHVPEFVSSKSLVVVSSYSGTTEEPLAAMEEARKRKAKLLAITSGGALAAAAKKFKFPAFVFSTENNPCGQPRMGLGYSIIGQMILLSKAGALAMGQKDFKEILAAVARGAERFGANVPTPNNRAKQLAEKIGHRSVWFVSAEHLAGNAHIAANQLNENAKRFGGYFLLPELNHHLIEGLPFPKNNLANLLFVCLESGDFDKRILKRWAVTQELLEKNTISTWTYRCAEEKPLAQAMEALLLSSYTSFYSAMLERIDPSPIPAVDFLKEQLKK